MTDIVDRLRSIDGASRRKDGSQIPLGHDLIEAADEILSLRAENEELRRALGEAEAVIDRIRASLSFSPPQNDTARRHRIARDLAEGLSLRATARKHGVGVGVVRGVARAAIGKAKP